jgi:catechol 2,3-dioxygenase-like lactoylglutathione lyase family enzyme
MMSKPTGLICGHYECRSLDETLPIFTDLLALEIVERRDHLAVVKHPNTDWSLIVHQGGTNAPAKPHNNHYGFRVAHHEEIEAAYKYLEANKARYGIKSVTKPHEAHFAYSVYFKEPGGNDLEIEYYNPGAAKHGRSIAAAPWKQLLPDHCFPGRGYIPQAMSHGTLQCDDQDASRRFYQEVLGLEIAGGGHRSTYIKHPATPWYIVVLPGGHRDYLARVNRFTLKLASAEQVVERHARFRQAGAEIGITHVDDVQENDGHTSFIFSDLDRNWWEFRS